MTTRPEYEEALVLLHKARSTMESQEKLLDIALDLLERGSGSWSEEYMEFHGLLRSHKSQLDIC